MAAGGLDQVVVHIPAMEQPAVNARMVKRNVQTRAILAQPTFVQVAAGGVVQVAARHPAKGQFVATVRIVHIPARRYPGRQTL